MFEYPIIAALRNDDDWIHLADSPVRTVFLMYGNLLGLKQSVKRLHLLGKKVVVHIELIKGLGQSKEAVSYIADQVRPEGIVTTKGHLIGPVKEAGLTAVLHLFLLDTNAFNTGIQLVKTSMPDAVEIMPGLMPRVVRDLSREITVPILAAGLIQTPEEIQSILHAGAKGVITGTSTLWGLHVEY